MDKLKEIALKYQKLVSITYNVYLGYKSNLTKLVITTSTDDFFHLAGLHKLKDMINLSRKSSDVFKSILNDELTYSMISSSEFFNEIEYRIEDLKNLENYLDNSKYFFGWSKARAVATNINSIIKADYLIKDKSICVENANNFIFLSVTKLDKNNRIAYLAPTETINVIPISIFSSLKDYARNQKHYTLLYKEKIDLNTNKKEILYKHHNFSLDTNENVSVEVAKEALSEQQPTAPAKKSIYAMAMENQKAKKQPKYNKNKNDISL